MADPTDISQVAQDAQTATTNVDGLSRSIESFISEIERLGGRVPVLEKMVSVFKDIGQTSEGFFEIIKNGVEEVDSAKIFDAGISLPFIQNILGAEKSFKSFTDSVSKSSFQVSGAYQDMSNVIAKSMTALTGGNVKAAQILTTLGREWYDSSQSARDFEAAVLKNAAVSGDLGNVYRKTGNDLHGLDDIMASWRLKILAASEATGTSSIQTQAYASSLSKIPGAMDALVDLGPGKNLNMLNAIMAVSIGTNRDIAESIQNVTEAYNKFGRTGKTALEVLSDVTATSKVMGLPLATVETSIKSISERFIDMGDNAESAIKIFQRFAPALRDAKISPDQIAATITHIGDGIKSMDIAQKAFLSSQSGGPGGLAGAYKIENLIKGGNVADVAKMAEEALRKQFGGRILTLEDAQKNEGSAAEFTKQVKFLQSGAFGKLASSDQDAYKLLDVFKKGSGFEQLNKFGSSTDNMRDALEISTSAIERNTDAITIANNKTQFVAQTASAKALSDQRAVSIEGPLGERIRDLREAGEKTGATTDVLGGSRTRSNREVQDQAIKELGQGVSILGDAAVGIFKQVTTGGVNVAEEVGRAATAPTSKNKNNEEPLPLNSPITAREGIVNPTRTVFESKDQNQPAAFVNQPNQNTQSELKVNVECPECHRKHLETIVIDKIQQTNRADAARVHTGIGNR